MSNYESRYTRSRRLERAADQWLNGGWPDVARATDGRETREPWFETFEQKLEWRRRLKKFQNRHKKLAAEMEQARRHGLVRPAKWSEAKWAEYQSSPWDLALAEQREIDAELERRRGEEILRLMREVAAISQRISEVRRAQGVHYPTDEIEAATRTRRERLRELRRDDWRRWI